MPASPRTVLRERFDIPTRVTLLEGDADTHDGAIHDVVKDVRSDLASIRAMQSKVMLLGFSLLISIITALVVQVVR